MMKNGLRLSAAIAALLCACAPRWEISSGKLAAHGKDYSVELPPGWRQFETADGLRVTRDGLALQAINISRQQTDIKLPFTQKKITEGMLPQEIAETLADDMRLDTSIINQKILENSPTTIGGYPGFKLSAEFQTKYGLRKRVVYYGLLLNRDFYKIQYVAPSRYYFSKDIGAFERVKDSFQLNHPAR